MQKEDVVYEVYWDDEDGNTFYAGCKNQEGVSKLIQSNNLRLGNTRIISVKEDKVINVGDFLNPQ